MIENDETILFKISREILIYFRGTICGVRGHFNIGGEPGYV